MEEEGKEEKEEVGRWVALQVNVVEVEVEGRLLGRRAVGSLAMLCTVFVVWCVFAVRMGVSRLCRACVQPHIEDKMGGLVFFSPASQSCPALKLFRDARACRKEKAEILIVSRLIAYRLSDPCISSSVIVQGLFFFFY